MYIYLIFQIYSVRVRDKGPDYRGFVQLPVIQSIDGPGDSIFLSSDPLTESLSSFPQGRCYVETCQRSMNKQVSNMIYLF